MKIMRNGLAFLAALGVLILFAWQAAGWLTKAVRATPVPPVRPVPFALLVRQVQLVPVSAYEASQGYDTKVLVLLDHIGPIPSWWGQSINGLGVGSYGDEGLYYQNGAKRQRIIAPIPWTAPFVWAPEWNENQQCYTARYLVDLAHVPASSGTVTLRGHLAVGMLESQKKPLSPPVLVSIPVRLPGRVVPAPVVSHDPMLTIEDVEMIKYTPAHLHANGGMDTRVTVRLQYHSLEPLADPNDPKWRLGYPELTDDRKRDVRPSRFSYGEISEPAARSGGALTVGRQFQLSYEMQSSNFTRLKTLTLTNSISAGNRWPLSYQIILHDSKASFWAKPGRKPWFSHPRVLPTKAGYPHT